MVINKNMGVLENKYLKFIKSVDLFSWDVKSYFVNQWVFNEKNPLVLFGEFLSKYETTKINIEDDKIYKILWVRTYWEGVFINRTVKWSSLKMRKYQLADKNTLFWCKVDTKNWWFGVVKDEQIWWLWSTNMFFAKIDTQKINKDYLQILFKSSKIHSYMDQYVTWTTNRKYIKPDQLLNEIKIPLPSLLEEQNKIVENYNKKLKEAKEAEKRVEFLEKEIESYLMEELGIEIEEERKKKKGLQLINFNNIQEWSIEKMLENSFISSNKYDLSKFQDICKKITDWTHQTPTYTTKEKGITFISSKDVTTKEINWKNIKYIPKSLHMKISKNFNPEIWDIFLAKNWTTWVAAILEDEKEFAIYVSLAHISPIRKIVNPYFLLDYINSKFAKFQFDRNLVWVWVPNLHLSKIRWAKIPLPPLKIQEKIVKHIFGLKEEIKELKNLAENLKESAKKEFEEEIFSK